MSDDTHDRSRIWLVRHAYAFSLVLVPVWVIDFFLPGGWSSFWLTMLWLAAFAGHYFFVRALGSSDAWARDRALDLKVKSYDVRHIQEIERSAAEGKWPGKRGPELDR
ncbi:MAG TPA: hypothetical protein QGF63_20500 [Alphaproteobacteria bacterium]|jgi:thiol:disulfide interchange protein|nr:hypothetical protein [Alphaproteobacteria bacterium]MDP6269358.1 hypothetical protein [Alphaproteobacteria bacterium]MDP7426698.1 hypothetical protein [Alphaproteobacteria bacterium]HJM52203.1 hypothetical protein [Alphaproteobacteria bacterium]